MHTRHFPIHDFLFNGNYMIVFLFHTYMFFLDSDICMDSKTKLVGCKPYLLQELNPILVLNLLILLPLFHHTPEGGPGEKPCRGLGLPQSISNSKRRINSLAKRPLCKPKLFPSKNGFACKV